ncbi:hypothetical protein SEA_WEASELS2_189 [Rhodococcus phage Weasels2]|uniref:Uncharacterized protein n=1 Tax=Rhodococcus phage Weasels2 TaxID=1897437 RepID=A0A1I9SAG1_9CAUD|nr:hypothetical protein FDH04_gp227 [Rhodococcus phage Weasels2]AOZ63767.1 hypothetical protein SEA_WEASELS2_189 [Rhodococcus phage Weasels2]
MPAALEQRGKSVSLFSRRMIPWHNLGQIVQDDITSKEDVLKLAKLNGWNIRLEADADLLPDDYSTKLNLWNVVRNNPWYEDGVDNGEKKFDVIGKVGSRYNPLQNEELAEFAESLLAGGRWETAGSTEDGTVVFMSMALDSSIVIDEFGVNETIESYLVVRNSHNASSQLTAAVTNIRPVCKNTLDWGLSQAARKVNIRHTSSMQERMIMAKETLDLAAHYNEEFQVSAENLFQVPVTNAEKFDIFATVYPEPDEDGSKLSLTRWNNKMDDLEAIWNSDTIDPIRGTAWGVLNTLEEELQWNRGVYSGDEEAFWVAGSGLDDGTISKKKTNLFNIVSSMTLV